MPGYLNLTSASSARAEGSGSLSRLLQLVGVGAARARGVGTVTRFLNLTTVGAARADGGAWPSWDSPPRISAALEDAWFYGHTKVKDMPGAGAARAGGTGVIS